MSYWQDTEDPEEAQRVRAVAVQAAGLTLDALRAAAPCGTYEHGFLRRDPRAFDAVDFALLDRLAWHYRRRLPRYLRPALNPDDSIVREQNG